MTEMHYILIGAGVVCAVWILLHFLKKSDPLPERDPKCIWHTTVTRLDRIYDGDTFYAHIKGHDPIDKKPAGIRVRGIDTPEMKDERPAVKKKAQKAKDFVENELKNAGTIHLYNVSLNDKYGRVLATVFCDGKDLAKMLVEKRLAKRYDGGTKQGW